VKSQECKIWFTVIQNATPSIIATKVRRPSTHTPTHSPCSPTHVHILIITVPLCVPHFIKHLWMKGKLLVKSPERHYYFATIQVATPSSIAMRDRRPWTHTPTHPPYSPTHVHIFIITILLFIPQLMKHLWMKGKLSMKSQEWQIWRLGYTKRNTFYHSHERWQTLNLYITQHIIHVPQHMYISLSYLYLFSFHISFTNVKQTFNEVTRIRNMTFGLFKTQHPLS
jgi:hypothetical protein